MKKPRDIYGDPIETEETPGDPLADPDKVFVDICRHYGREPEEVINTTDRSRAMVVIRESVAVTMHDTFGFSLSEIGRSMDCSHTSVLYRLRRWREKVSRTRPSRKIAGA